MSQKKKKRTKGRTLRSSEPVHGCGMCEAGQKHKHPPGRVVRYQRTKELGEGR